MINQKIKKTATDYVKYVQDQGFIISKAYVFGSRAKGNFHKDSDIDICLVSPNFGNDFHAEITKLWILANKIDNRIEPHPMGSREFREKYNLLAHEIKTFGIPLDIN